MTRLHRAVSTAGTVGSLTLTAALVVLAPSRGRAWDGWGGSRGGGSTSNACQVTNARQQVAFSASNCLTCHGQATAAVPAQPASAQMMAAFVVPYGYHVPGLATQVGPSQVEVPLEPAHPACSTDPNARCPQVAFVHHVAPLGPQCLLCHNLDPNSPGGISVQTNCLACHASTGAVSMGGVTRPGHAVDTHRFVRDSCGRCHPEPVAQIHAGLDGGSDGRDGRGDRRSSGGFSSNAWGGGGSSGGGWSDGGWGGRGSSASPAAQAQACFFCHGNFPRAVAVGLQRGCGACSDCHGR